MGGCEHKWITCMWSAKGSHSPHLERIRNIRLCCDLTVRSCKSRKKKTSVDHSLNQDMSLQWTWQGRYLHYRLVVFIRHHDRDAFEFLLLLNVYLQGNIKINHLKINHSQREKKKKSEERIRNKGQMRENSFAKQWIGLYPRAYQPAPYHFIQSMPLICIPPLLLQPQPSLPLDMKQRRDSWNNLPLQRWVDTAVVGPACHSPGHPKRSGFLEKGFLEWLTHPRAIAYKLSLQTTWKK